MYYINSREIPGELSRVNMISSHMLFSHVKITRSPLLKLHNLLESTQMCCCMIKTSSVLPRKPLLIFGNLWQSSENVQKCLSGLQSNFGKSSEIFGKCSEIFGKSSKMSLLVCLYTGNTQNITCLLVYTNFIFSSP